MWRGIRSGWFVEFVVLIGWALVKLPALVRRCSPLNVFFGVDRAKVVYLAVQCYAISTPLNGIKWTQTNGSEETVESGVGFLNGSEDIVESGSGFPNSSTECDANSNVRRTGSNVGETIGFSCEDGYQLVGSQSIVCLSSGSWSNSPPLCLRQ